MSGPWYIHMNMEYMCGVYVSAIHQVYFGKLFVCPVYIHEGTCCTHPIMKVQSIYATYPCMWTLFRKAKRTCFCLLKCSLLFMTVAAMQGAASTTQRMFVLWMWVPQRFKTAALRKSLHRNPYEQSIRYPGSIQQPHRENRIFTLVHVNSTACECVYLIFFFHITRSTGTLAKQNRL